MKPNSLRTAGFVLFFLLIYTRSFADFVVIAPVFNEGTEGISAVMQPPPNTFTYNTPVCRNSTNNFPIVFGPQPPGTYVSTSGLPINPTTGEIFPNGAATGNYTITHTGSLATAIVFVPPQGFPSISPANVSICQGNTVNLVANISGPGIAAAGFTWNTGSNASSVFVSPNTSTTYSVMIKDNYGCVYTLGRNVTVSSISGNLGVNNPSTCAGKSTTLGVISGAIPGMTFNWAPGGFSGQVISVSPMVPTVYTVTAFAFGCTKTLTAFVNAIPVPQSTVSFNYPFPLCSDSGDPLPIKAEGFTEGGVFYSEDPGVIVDPVTGKVKIGGLESTTYIISYSLAEQGCRAEVTSPTFLPIIQSTNIGVSGNQTIEDGQGVIISATGEGAFLWEPSAGLNCEDCASPYARPSQTTRYCVSDPTNGCARGNCVTIEVVCMNNGDMSVPTAFTPNKDGRNDKFCLKGWSYCVADFRMRIFNRWGQIVYDTNDSGFCWDGSFNGEDLPAGVYVYTISANLNRAPYSKNGNITIIR